MREHEVPTHLQQKDKVLLGLTFPQIVAIAAVVGLAYGLWKQAAFLPDGTFRRGVAIVVSLLGLAVVALRPGGRALPTVVLDLLTPPVVETPKPKREKRGRPRLWRPSLRFKGFPFKTMSLFMAVVVLLTSIAPSVALAAGPATPANEYRSCPVCSA